MQTLSKGDVESADEEIVPGAVPSDPTALHSVRTSVASDV